MIVNSVRLSQTSSLLVASCCGWARPPSNDLGVKRSLGAGVDSMQLVVVLAQTAASWAMAGFITTMQVLNPGHSRGRDLVMVL